MKDKTCCFTGHREISGDINQLELSLKPILTQLINSGIIYFGAGGARGFDTFAAQTILELKPIYPHIKLILVLPCPNQTKGWHTNDI
ncbi:MAG: DUF1273 family protein, partial [Clostridia bacterium]|nr:DUF1273 family protein [Clostridia bacterium]